jgi:WD40 repeat protein
MSETPSSDIPATPPAREVPAALVGHPRYRVVQLLGAGGMGAVYKAEHRLMERPVALKVINPNLVDEPAAVERFRREVRTAARLAHPNIVTALDAEQAGNTHFLVMEYVEGTDLAEVVRRKGPLPVAHACAYVRQAALGLQHAYERGMVHRDIKPHNLLLTRQGQVKILDFGLARFAREAGPATPLTAVNSMMGTPDYVAPEQANDARSADIRADIYSLGCTLYHLLTGRPPFGHLPLMGKLVAHVQEQPRPVTELRPEVPAEVAAVLERMLAKDPARRYPTPAAVAQALAPFARPGVRPPTRAVSGSDTLPVLKAQSPMGTIVPRGRRHGWLLALAGAVLVLAGGLGYWGYTSPSGRPAAPPPRPAANVTAPVPPGPAPVTPARVGQIYAFEGHRDEVWAVSFSPDGRRILSAGGGLYSFDDKKWQASKDATLRLWDVATGRELGPPFTGHSDGIFGAVFTPDGQRILSGSHDGTVRLWDVASREELHRFTGHKNKVRSVAVSRDGRYGLSGGFDRTVRLWDLVDKKAVREFSREGGPAHTSSIWSVALSPDGKQALTGSQDLSMRLWDVGTGAEVRAFPKHPYGVRCVAFLPDGRAVSACGSRTGPEGGVRLWDVETGKLLNQFTGPGEGWGVIVALAVSPSRRRVLFGNLTGNLRLLDLETGQLVWAAALTEGAILAVAFSPDGRYALSGGADHVVRLWGLPAE